MKGLIRFDPLGFWAFLGRCDHGLNEVSVLTDWSDIWDESKGGGNRRDHPSGCLGGGAQNSLSLAPSWRAHCTTSKSRRQVGNVESEDYLHLHRRGRCFPVATKRPEWPRDGRSNIERPAESGTGAPHSKTLARDTGISTKNKHLWGP